MFPPDESRTVPTRHDRVRFDDPKGHRELAPPAMVQVHERAKPEGLVLGKRVEVPVVLGFGERLDGSFTLIRRNPDRSAEHGSGRDDEVVEVGFGTDPDEIFEVRIPNGVDPNGVDNPGNPPSPIRVHGSEFVWSRRNDTHEPSSSPARTEVSESMTKSPARNEVLIQASEPGEDRDHRLAHGATIQGRPVSVATTLTLP
ncbi:MAG: hypothetical protein ABJ314_10140 [Ilumatobacter sp.]|uniref:hypothetical protein n=1 Tax=Ilumatobacter sp. TaxID=1967498 RepID=UPI00329790C1